AAARSMACWKRGSSMVLAYIAQWRRHHEPAQDVSDALAEAGDLDALVEARATTLHQRYPRERLEQLVAQGGADAGLNGGEHASAPTEGHDTEDEESDR
ncbi:MAG: hypothetical protein AAFO29_14880, partial [Actinomycetota bacterium]